jgi:hypothetical protein
MNTSPTIQRPRPGRLAVLFATCSLAVLGLTLGSSTGTATAASTTTAARQEPAVALTPGDGRIGLANYKSNKVLQPVDGSSASYVNIVQEPLVLSGGDLVARQSFTYTLSGGYYVFKNVSSGKVLGIDRASTADFAAVIQAPADGSLNQQFQFRTYVGYPAGIYRLVNRKSQKCIGINGASTADGALALQAPCDGSLKQGWRVVDN